MKKLFLLLVLATTLAANTADTDFYDRVNEFDRHWILFSRDLAGCTEHQPLYPDADCSVNRSVINRKEFGRAREAAMKLFELYDRP